MDAHHRFQIGKVCHGAGVLHQRETFYIERTIAPSRVGDFNLYRGERDEILFMRVGVEIRALLGAFAIADLRP